MPDLEIVTWAVGAELTYEGEQILKGNVSEFLDYDGDNLAAVLIANPYGGEMR